MKDHNPSHCPSFHRRRLVLHARAIVWSVLTGCILAFGPLFGGAQSRRPQVSATLASGVVRLGETTQVTVTAEGSLNARLREIPSVEGLRFGRPQQGTYESYINGRRSLQMRFDVGLRAEEEGEFTIPPFTVEIDGQMFETRPLVLRVVRDMRGEELGFLEVRPTATRVVEGQPFGIELVLGLDPAMGYAEPRLPWWEELPGTVELEGRPLDPGSRVTVLKINGRIEVEVEFLGAQERDGREYNIFRLERRVLPVRSGTLEVSRSHVEFGRRGEDRGLFSRRSRKLDSYFVSAEAFEVEVVPLPEEDRPVDFGGAVGNLTARARTDTRDVVVGDSIKLTVDWEGEGNLEFFDAPDPGRLDSFRAFRSYGKTEEKSAERRRVTYDLAPLSEDTTQIPPLPLTVFDPVRERYVTVSTDPIPIRVRPLEGGSASLEDRALETERDIVDIDPRPLGEGFEPETAAPSNAVVGGALFGAPLVLLGLRTVVRRRRGDPARPAARRRRRAPKVLARALARDASPAAAAAAFAEFLGARTEESEAAWEGRDVLAWNQALPPDLRLSEDAARDLDDVRRRLEAAVFGGGQPPSTKELLAAARATMEAGL